MQAYTITLTEAEMLLLNQAIGELPHRLAVPLIASINRQITQDRPAPEGNGAAQTPMATQGAN